MQYIVAKVNEFRKLNRKIDSEVWEVSVKIDLIFVSLIKKREKKQIVKSNQIFFQRKSTLLAYRLACKSTKSSKEQQEKWKVNCEIHC